MTTSTAIRFGKKTVTLSNLDKVFYPETGFTKGDVLDNYRAVAEVCVHI